jgi:sialidase-1
MTTGPSWIHRRLPLLGAIALVAGFNALAANASPQFTDVFVSGTDGYHTYRIPAIVVSKQGTLLAFCEGRKSSRSDTGKIDLLLKRSLDGGRTWLPHQLIRADHDNVCGNPGPVVDQTTGQIWLLMTWNRGEDEEREILEGKSIDTRRVFATSSRDDGLTWSEPREITRDVKKPHWRWYATGPVNGIQLTRGPHKGRLVIPANHSDHADPSKHPFRAHIIYSDDHGKNWKLGGVEEDKTNESTLAEKTDGSLLHNMRSYHGKNRRAVATSTDGGLTWSPVTLDEALVHWSSPSARPACSDIPGPKRTNRARSSSPTQPQPNAKI